MNSFAIDLYVWNPDLNDWLLVPARGSGLRWPAFPGISQADLVSSSVGISFRVDETLCLGNERDDFPVELVLHDLSNTLQTDLAGALLARMAENEFISIEVRQGTDDLHVLLSRTNTRALDPGDYLELTARHTGAYYVNFPVEVKLWRAAVRAALGGFADALAASPLPAAAPEHERLARWLLENHGPPRDAPD
ncbi:hypothetical protein [Corallococcus sicarius]|uniref:Uncharacterized protein n=1 Tax=Corallococcus sicarius TaxID=2316726 RepID=A0A3A8NBX1_9BACT|nr:hypothetical protein [Corallococcus sicarius]RKH40950.1 hypothetical protein D7X12_19545 [Corallococcus sicarius]